MQVEENHKSQMDEIEKRNKIEDYYRYKHEIEQYVDFIGARYKEEDRDLDIKPAISCFYFLHGIDKPSDWIATSLLDTFELEKMTQTEVSMSSKRYPEEFKIEAVKQVTVAGHSVVDVAARLGMTTHSLYAWIKRYGPDSEQHNQAAAEAAEIRRLKKELQRVTEERDLLKKAAAYFAKHHD